MNKNTRVIPFFSPTHNTQVIIWNTDEEHFQIYEHLAEEIHSFTLLKTIHLKDLKTKLDVN